MTQVHRVQFNNQNNLGADHMTVTQAEIQTLVKYCEENLGDKTLWQTPEGYPDSLALCIIDSLYSTGSHYTSVVNVITKYKTTEGTAHGAQDLLDSIEKAGGPRGWAENVVGNLKPAHTKAHAPLKAEIIERAAQLMVDLGIDTVEELRTVVEASPQENPVHTGWKKLPSQSSGVTYNYLLILAGMPSVKPDRMILRFLADALGKDSDLYFDRAVELIQATADELQVSSRTLDHIVWRAASGRELVD
ncbi:heme peroxidase [Nesterenkonia jeotgali]